MRRVLFFASVVAGALAWACDGTAPTDPAHNVIQTARRAPAMFVPIQGEAAIQVDPTGGLLPCLLAGDDEPVTYFPARFTSEGEYSHLGRTTSVIELLACTANLDGTLAGPGSAVHTGANGDTFHADWFGVFAPDGTIDLTLEITGGTGRFLGATGEGTGGAATDPTTLTGTWWFEGWISRVGSK